MADNLHKAGWREFGLGSLRYYPASRRRNFLLVVLGVQYTQMRRFIELSVMNTLYLLVILLFFMSGSFVNAGPVGNFFKKVGQSISKPLQREPQPQPQPQAQPEPQSARAQSSKAPRATRRSSSRAAPAAAVTPPSDTQPAHGPKEEESTAPVRRVSAADVEKIKAGLPYGIPVAGRKGMVSSPYLPEEDKYIDVTGFSSGSIVKDPYTEKFFLVP